jgi:hypothetical protein
MMKMEYSVYKEEMKDDECGWSKTIHTGNFIRLLHETDNVFIPAAVPSKPDGKIPCFPTDAKYNGIRGQNEGDRTRTEPTHPNASRPLSEHLAAGERAGEWRTPPGRRREGDRGGRKGGAEAVCSRRWPPVVEGELRREPSLLAGSGRKPTTSARHCWKRSRVAAASSRPGPPGFARSTMWAGGAAPASSPHRRRNRGGRAPRPCSGATAGRRVGTEPPEPAKKTPPPPLPLFGHGHGRTLRPSSSFTASPLRPDLAASPQRPDLAGGGAPRHAGGGAARRPVEEHRAEESGAQGRSSRHRGAAAVSARRASPPPAREVDRGRHR